MSTGQLGTMGFPAAAQIGSEWGCVSPYNFAPSRIPLKTLSNEKILLKHSSAVTTWRAQVGHQRLHPWGPLVQAPWEKGVGVV